MVLEKDDEDIMDRKLTNEALLEKVGSERQLLTTIRRKQWRFVEYELRREGGMGKNILEAEMAGKRARGRQRLKMLGWIMERFRAKDREQLPVLQEIGKDGDKENRRDPSTVLNAMTL